MSVLSVFVPHRFTRLLAGDALNVSRDPMLIFAMLMSVAPSIMLHFVQPGMDAAALSAFGVPAISIYVVPLALLVPAALIGWVTGFLLLEDRDEGTLLALDVTPIGKSGFLAYRVSITALATLSITLFAWPLILPGLGVGMAFFIAALVAADAVAAAVILPAIARNKVEGLALTKLTNLASVVPVLAFLPSPLRHLAGIVPTYWIGEFIAPSGLPLPVAAGLAVAVHLAAITGLFRLLRRRAG